MRQCFYAVALAAALAPTAARAEPIPQVQDFIKSEITKLQTVPQVIAGPVQGYEGDGYKLTLFRLRIRADLGFDITFAKLTLSPYIELFWE